MRKLSILITIIAGFAVFGLISCGNSKAKLQDGVYFAQADNWDSGGWKTQVILTVRSGNITDTKWNGISHMPGALDKKTTAKTGQYGMSVASKQGEWDVQAKAVEDYIVRTQNIALSKFDAEGKTDAISGATISVKDFFNLVNKALTSAPIPKGMYAKDGWFYAESNDFDVETGWKGTVLVTVVHGSIVDVLWNGINKDPQMKSKIIESIEGRYGMEKVAKQGPWHLQASRIESAIVKAQDPVKIPVKANGTTNAISGATITVEAVSLAQKALQRAK